MRDSFIQEESVEKELNKIGVTAFSIRILLPKARFRLIKLHGINSGVANLLKQNMLSLGGDVAVKEGTFNCKQQKTDILIMGTSKQINELIYKMRISPLDGPRVGHRIKKLMNKW